jgi:hypothetical protein
MTPNDTGICIDVIKRSCMIYLRCLKIFCVCTLVFWSRFTRNSGVCLLRARTKTTMNAFGGTFTCISHLSRFWKDLSETENRFLCSLPNLPRICMIYWLHANSYVSTCMYQFGKLKTVSVCTSTETENRFHHHILEKCTATFFLQ